MSEVNEEGVKERICERENAGREEERKSDGECL